LRVNGTFSSQSERTTQVTCPAIAW
jgi:hypothetical protein